jgi:hypothetical protein
LKRPANHPSFNEAFIHAVKGLAMHELISRSGRIHCASSRHGVTRIGFIDRSTHPGVHCVGVEDA